MHSEIETGIMLTDKIWEKQMKQGSWELFEEFVIFLNLNIG